MQFMSVLLMCFSSEAAVSELIRTCGEAPSQGSVHAGCQPRAIAMVRPRSGHRSWLDASLAPRHGIRNFSPPACRHAHGSPLEISPRAGSHFPHSTFLICFDKKKKPSQPLRSRGSSVVASLHKSRLFHVIPCL